LLLLPLIFEDFK